MPMPTSSLARPSTIAGSFVQRVAELALQRGSVLQAWSSRRPKDGFDPHMDTSRTTVSRVFVLKSTTSMMRMERRDGKPVSDDRPWTAATAPRLFPRVIDAKRAATPPPTSRLCPNQHHPLALEVSWCSDQLQRLAYFTLEDGRC